MRCGGYDTMLNPDSCTSIEYADATHHMANLATDYKSFVSSYHRALNNWYIQGNLMEVVTSGVYTLDLFDTPDQRNKIFGIRVPVPASFPLIGEQYTHYYIEYGYQARSDVRCLEIRLAGSLTATITHTQTFMAAELCFNGLNYVDNFQNIRVDAIDLGTTQGTFKLTLGQ